MHKAYMHHKAYIETCSLGERGGELRVCRVQTLLELCAQRQCLLLGMLQRERHLLAQLGHGVLVCCDGARQLRA